MHYSTRTLITFVFTIVISSASLAQELISNTGSVSFIAPKEDGVEATSQSLTSKINLDSKEIIFSLPVQAFTFASSRMQEHFNQEGVMNSAEYPKAKFKGSIITGEDLTKDGSYAVLVDGEMTIKGSTQAFSTEGEVVVKDGKTEVSSSFTINGFDFGVDSKSFGDVVNVTLNATYE